MVAVVISRGPFSHLLLLFFNNNYNAKNQTLACFRLFSSPPLPPPHEDQTLISSVASILREQRSKSRWNFIKTLYPHGFTPRQASQITLALKNNPRLALRFFLWSHNNSLCTHDLLSYSTIIHILARARLKTSAQTLIQTALRLSQDDHHHDKPPKMFQSLASTYRHCDSAPFVFDLLIRACLQAKRVDQTLHILRMLRSRNIHPTIHTSNFILKNISLLRGSHAALSIYTEIFTASTSTTRLSPNPQTFNTLMLTFYQDQNMAKVEEIWEEMACGCHPPNVFSYSILLAAFCDRGKMEGALRLWEEMRVKEIKPDVTSYNTLIKGLCANGQTQRAEEIFRDMGLNRIVPTCLTLEHLIRGHCEAAEVDSALHLYRDLCRTKEFTPEALTVEQLIRAMCGNNKTSDALNLLREAVKKHEICPTGQTYELLIRGLCEEGRMEDALKLQSEMVGKGFEPDAEIYSLFISGYNKQGNGEKSRNLNKEMLEFCLRKRESVIRE